MDPLYDIVCNGNLPDRNLQGSFYNQRQMNRKPAVFPANFIIRNAPQYTTPHKAFPNFY